MTGLALGGGGYIALPLHHIGTVDARREHADQDLVRLRLGERTRGHAQHVGIPRPGGLDISHLIRQFHRTLLVSSRRLAH